MWGAELGTFSMAGVPKGSLRPERSDRAERSADVLKSRSSMSCVYRIVASSVLTVWTTAVLCCTPEPVPMSACEGSVSTDLGVFWREPDAGAPDTYASLKSPRIGDLDHLTFAAEAPRIALASVPEDASARSVAAAALLSRFTRRGEIDDLLDAGELLAHRVDDVAARCNRVLVLRHLGLPYRVAEAAEECPCVVALERIVDLDPPFPLDGQRHSADQLSSSELDAVEGLLAQGALARASQRLRRASQAWREWFERGALELWRTAPTEAGRREVVARVKLLAELYAETSQNPAPARFWAQLSAVPPHRVEDVKRGLGRWLEGLTALSRYDLEQVEAELVLARRELSSALPALRPSIDLALAAAQFHLGNDLEMLSLSLEVRRRAAREAHPWAWARALWLEAIALQAQADWSEALRRAEEAGRIYAELGEPANAGYQDTIRGVSLEAQAADGDAAEAYALGVARIYRAGDSRRLAFALAIFARHQSRAGRPHLAVELQRESVILNSVDATPQLVAEAKAVLAEQLFSAGEQRQGNRVLREARMALRQIESAQPRRRAEAIIAQAEALGLRDSDPVAAEAALGRFLSTFEDFGERFFRTEALIQRAEVRLALGKLFEAEEDLAAALDEIADQSESLEDRIQAVMLLDRAREALDILIEVLLRGPGGGDRALGWIEALRAEQTGLGFGSGEGAVARRGIFAAAPEGHCITQYWAMASELLAWTSCDRAPPRLTRTMVGRDDLAQALEELRNSAQSHGLDELRVRSEAVSGWLVAPIGSELSESVSWIVIPDALFPAFPVAWLTLDGRFVFEDRAVKGAPSWSLLEETPASAVGSWLGLGIGDAEPVPESPPVRLPFAREEVERLRGIFPGSIAKVGREATWGALVRHAGSFNLLHLATHLSSGSRVPLSARLELTPELARPDGRVSADEVARARFPGLRLAVVASCSSGAAAPARLAGSLDFAHAFLHAGAEEVLGTLWNVPDRETALVIREFYDHLEVGLEPEQALRRVWLTGLEEETDAAGVNVRAALQLFGTHP